MGQVMLVEELAGTKASGGPHTSCWAASSSSVQHSFLLDCGHLPGAPPRVRLPGTGVLAANTSSNLSLQPPPNPSLVCVSWWMP